MKQSAAAAIARALGATTEAELVKASTICLHSVSLQKTHARISLNIAFRRVIEKNTSFIHRTKRTYKKGASLLARALGLIPQTRPTLAAYLILSGTPSSATAPLLPGLPCSAELSLPDGPPSVASGSDPSLVLVEGSFTAGQVRRPHAASVAFGLYKATKERALSSSYGLRGLLSCVVYFGGILFNRV